MTRAVALKGQVKLGGQLLEMTFEAWMAFEQESGRKLPDHLYDLNVGLSCDDIVAWVKAFLVEEKSREEVIALISSTGFPETLAALTATSSAFFGTLVEDGKANPPKAE